MNREKFDISGELAFELLDKYGSPLYIYNEEILRERCREMKNLLTINNFRVNYSAKANTNLEILKIVREEGLDVDAMSPGEIYLEEKAGFTADRIFYISNNVSAAEMNFAIERGVMVSVDSLAQLELYGKLNQGGKVAVRFNPGIGVGHHQKVTTGGKKTKFAVQREFIPQVKDILQKYKLTLVGINQHMGSLFMDSDKYIDGMKNLFEIASEFPALEFIDLGGGFGIPYKPADERLDLLELSKKMTVVVERFIQQYGNPDLSIKIEPGRYIVAEAGLLLGTVQATKENYGVKYVGTDLGFNVLMRPMLYDSYHQVRIIKSAAINRKQDSSFLNKDQSENNNDQEINAYEEAVNIVGNICESGDIIAKGRELPAVNEGDLIAVLDTGAYGFSMASNYNCRLRPAEVLITTEGKQRLIRRRDTLEDLIRNF